MVNSAFAGDVQNKLLKSIKAGKKKAVKQIITNNPDLINTKIEYHTYPLLEAISKSKWDIALFLLNQGADVLVKDKNLGGTPIQCLAKKSSKINPDLFKELITLLVNNGADINEENSDGKTPFAQLVSFSVSEKNLQVFLKKISILLEHGAKLPQKDNPILFNVIDSLSRSKKGTKLPILQVFKVLVDAGADIHAKDSKGYNLLMKLMLVNSKYIKVPERIQFADYLLEQGIDINDITPEKNTALHLLLIDRYKAVSFNDKLSLAEYLIENGAKTTLKNKKHQSPKKLAKNKKKLYRVIITTKKNKNHSKQKRK